MKIRVQKFTKRQECREEADGGYLLIKPLPMESPAAFSANQSTTTTTNLT